MTSLGDVMSEARTPRLGMTAALKQGVRSCDLFGADGEDLFALDLDFYTERRANVAALHDGATNPNVPG
jgi:hypothetical protein